MERDAKIARLIDDIVSCADEADGGQDDARAFCEELVALLATPAPVAAPPADLVALVRDYQRVIGAVIAKSRKYPTTDVEAALLTFPLPDK